MDAIDSTVAETQAQHDVCEFAVRVLQRLKPPSLRGQWVSRLADPLSRDYDRGMLLAPIVMGIPVDANSIQACINNWREQLALHGLEAGSSMRYIQLRRFSHAPSSRTLRKLGQLFHVVGGIYHLGPTPHSGHYRSFLSWTTMNPGNHDGLFTFPGHVMTADDHVAGKWATPEDAEEICRHVFLILCVKTKE